MKRGKTKEIRKRTTVRQNLQKARKSKKKPILHVPNRKVDTIIKDTTKKVLGSKERKKNIKKKEQTNSFKLSSDQLNELGDNYVKYNSFTAVELKNLLKKNNQVMSGNKNDLVERCAQGKLLGAIPSCPQCFAGKLRFNLKTGEYKCPGYMDDTDFMYCTYKSSDLLLRNIWID